MWNLPCPIEVSMFLILRAVERRRSINQAQSKIDMSLAQSTMILALAQNQALAFRMSFRTRQAFSSSEKRFDK